MSDKTKLSDNHRRVISARLQMIERTINEIELMLNSNPSSFLRRVEELFGEGDTRKLKKQLQIIKKILSDIASEYQLKFSRKSQRAMVLSRLSGRLDMAEDMYAEKLQGYGSFNTKLQQDYDKRIKQLEKAIKLTFKPFNNT